MTSRKIQEATRRLVALADKFEVSDPEEYQNRVIETVRGPLEEAIRVLQKPGDADLDYMVNPNNNTTEVELGDNSAEDMEMDDDVVDNDDRTIGVDDNFLEDDQSNVDPGELPEPSDGDIVVGDEILYVHEYLGDQWTQMIVSLQEIAPLDQTCAHWQMRRWIRKQSHP